MIAAPIRLSTASSSSSRAARARDFTIPARSPHSRPRSSPKPSASSRRGSRWTASASAGGPSRRSPPRRDSTPTPQPGATLDARSRHPRHAMTTPSRTTVAPASTARRSSELVDCLGPMLPLADFDAPDAMRERLALLRDGGAAPGRFRRHRTDARRDIDASRAGQRAAARRSTFHAHARSSPITFRGEPVFPGDAAARHADAPRVDLARESAADGRRDAACRCA